VAAVPEMHPERIPGYGDERFTHRPEWLDEPIFWIAHLGMSAQSEDAQRLLLGADYDAAGAFQRQIFEDGEWPAFTVPLAGAHRLYVVYRTFEGDEGVDYVLHHPDWEEAAVLASDEGSYTGPGLSWAELVAVCDNGLSGGTTTDPGARLLLLFPAFGDDDVSDDAVARLAAALQARTAVEEPEAAAAALLRDQGLTGPVHWTADGDGVRTNDGRYSRRTPVVVADVVQRRVSDALDPAGG
jgi:hypothetical protein